MNFILNSLPVMVMDFSMAVSIHYLYHFAGHMHEPDPVGVTLRGVSWPCFLAMFTTAIGLCSLRISEMPPIRQLVQPSFPVAAATAKASKQGAHAESADEPVPVIFEGDQEASSICTCKFQHGDRVTRLVCWHVFHANCWETAQRSRRSSFLGYPVQNAEEPEP